MPGVDPDGTQPTAQSDDDGGLPPVTPLQRVIAGIALIALLASAAVSSWWILSGQVDFTADRGAPSAATDARPADTTASEP